MASFHLATDLLTAIYDGIKSKIFLAVYPVGSVYLSVDQTNPNTLFGGTWSRITDGFLYCISGNGGGQGNLQNSAKTAASTGSTGGPSTTNTGSTTLTVDMIPAHGHNILRNWGGNGFAIPYGEPVSGWRLGAPSERRFYCHSCTKHWW